MPLTIDLHLRNDSNGRPSASVSLAGSLDTATASELEKQLTPVLQSPTSDIVFDLAKLDFISSAGLRVFAAVRKQLRARGGQASFVHLQPQIKKVFEIVAALPGIGVFRDVEELDSYLAQRQRAS